MRVKTKRLPALTIAAILAFLLAFGGTKFAIHAKNAGKETEAQAAAMMAGCLEMKGASAGHADAGTHSAETKKSCCGNCKKMKTGAGTNNLATPENDPTGH